MLKAILNLEGAQKLSAVELKSIMGGLPVQPVTCACFCYNAGHRVSAYCYAYCPDGSLPGIVEGSTGNCSFNPPNPKPEL